jgi:hypothetical protein
MTKLELKSHQVWHDLTELLENIDANTLLREHLELCDYKVCGYWDEQDEYYEEINLPLTLTASLVSSSIGFAQTKRFLQLKFVLLDANNAIKSKSSHSVVQSIGELTLIYNENLEFIDENWVLSANILHLEAKFA